MGRALIILAVAGVGWIYVPLISAEVNYQVQNAKVKTQNHISKLKTGNGGPPGVLQAEPEWTVPDLNYSIFIPKIEARSRVIADVSLADAGEYKAALKNGVAAAAGLGRPGETGTTYLFAHSTDSPINYARYNAVFYLLDKLEAGDRVEVVYKGKLFRYEVTRLEVLGSTDTRYLVPQGEEELLVLQTCYPPGTAWKRLVVVAKPV